MDFLGSSKTRIPSRSSTSPLARSDSLVSLDYKSFVCPNCNRHYEFQIRNTILFGRVPLVLDCKHTICEECVHNSLAKKIVVCGVCSDTKTLDENEKRKPQQMYYTNFYVLGLMLSNKPESVYSKFNLIPSGVNYSSRRRTESFQSNRSNLSMMDLSMPPVTIPQVNCSMFTCTLPATVKCQNCDEIFCNNCSIQLHQVSKTFMKHTIESLEPATPEINKKCKVHSDSFLDFFCKTCSTEVCCYCIVQFHTGHEYEQLTILESSKTSHFQSLVTKANDVLKIMTASQKNINKRMQRSQLGASTTKLEQEISSYFANLHAALQTIEYRLKAEASTANKNCSTDLININQMLSHNIMQLTNLVGIANSALSPHNAKKINMSLITEKLENSIKLPCHFVEEKVITDEELQFRVRENILNKIEDNFTIINPELTKYKLITTDELPEDFCVEEGSVLSSSISSFGDRSDDDILFSTPDRKKSDLYASEVYLSSDSASTTDTDKTYNNERQRRCGDQKESVIVTHINSPQSFFVQFYRSSKAIQNMIRDINVYVKNNCHFLIKEVKINNIYLVRYDQKGNQQWCRGRVISRLDDDVYSVFFIDYGNVEPIKRNLIMGISPDLARVAPFAIECKLFNLFPKDDLTWETKAVTLMAQILTGRVIMTTQNKSDGIYEIDLLSISVDGDTTSVREALLYMGYAITYCKSPPVERKKPNHMKTRMFRKPNTFKTDDQLVVILSHVTEELDVFVQFADFYHQIEALSEKLEKYYESKPKSNVIYVPEKGVPVAVKWNNGRKTTWFRGNVVDTLMGRGSVIVYLVDYGATINVNVTAVRRLLENFLPMECQAIKTKLAHIHVMHLEQCMNILQKYIMSETKLKMVVKNPEEIEVLLFEVFPTYDLCINALLVQEGAAISTGHLSQKVQWTKEVVKKQSQPAFTLDLMKTIQGRNTSNEYPSKSSPPCEEGGIKKPVKVLLAESPDLIYVSLEDDNIKEYQSSLHILLQEYYPADSKQKTNWELEDLCVVYNEHSKTFNRAIIKEIEGEKIKVFLCDGGKHITVSPKDVYTLDDKFKRTPNGAIRCHMSGITPAGDPNKWSRMAVEYLTELVAKEKNFFISKSGETDLTNKSLAITLWFQEITQAGPLEPSKAVLHSINNLLIVNGLALKCKKEPAQTQQVTDKDTKVPQEVQNAMQQVLNRFNEESEGRNNVEIKQNVEKDYKKNKHSKRGRNSNKKKNLQSRKKEGKLHGTIKQQREEEVITSDSDAKSSNLKSTIISKSQDNISVAPEEKALPHPQTSLSENNTPICQKKNNEKEAADWNAMIESQEKMIQLELEDTASSSSVEPENKIEDDIHGSSLPVPVESVPSDWLPPLEFSKTSFTAIATFVDNNAHIYLHELEIEPVLKKMEIEMKKVFNNCSPEPSGTVWFVGQMCTVKYFMNNSWYRGKIINITDDSIKVRMIDYGNEEDCKHEDLRSKVMFPDIPAIASKVCLYNVFAKSVWLTSDLDFLHSTIVDKQVTVVLKGNSRKKNRTVPAVLFVDLQNVNDYMLEQCSNLTSRRFKKNQNQTEDKDNDDEDVIIVREHSCDESSGKDSVINARKFTSAPLPAASDDTVEAAIISVIDYNKIIIEFSSDNDEQRFSEISHEMELQGDKQPPLKHFYLDAACIAKFSEDDTWYRAQIYSLDLLESGFVYVWFVDFGNFDTVSIENVKEIKLEWLDFPLQHFIAGLHGVELSRDGDDDLMCRVIDKLSENIQTMKKIEIIRRSPLRVNVFDLDANRLMYQDLIDSGDFVYEV
ncbi:uncharacterized protein LOC108738643 isoform X2 [Agrilus planipennis]|uniref:Uncharacterized protein LOC108738643 isoform X2 n=1 Tax=Agrilus planipennis TaxID=224129 RepID=A0A1W4X4B9_AGRPL|nr:uncharacterized protein LOC108738643 isoform X2 [Agrilus planipennis]